MAAYICDLLLGDPQWIPHPVVLIGKLIYLLEAISRRIAKNGLMLRIAGMLTTVFVVGSSWFITNFLAYTFFQINYWLGSAISVLLISSTIAAKGLAEAAAEIYRLLEAGNLKEARLKAGLIVGRDTGNLDKKGVTRATVETVAENIVDGVVAPIFYAFIGGAPLAMAYKAVNTLDSMLGYRNEKYIDFGKFPARFDDAANYIPARLTGFFIVCSAFLLRHNAFRSIAAIVKYASGHPSPNSGIPESAVAGALGVRLGGLNRYHGKESFRAYMGEELIPLEPAHILKTVRIMYVSTTLTVLTGTLVSYLISLS